MAPRKRPSHGYTAERCLTEYVSRSVTLSSPATVMAQFLATIPDITAKEHFVGFYLDSRNALLHTAIISIGSLNASIVHPREVMRPAIVHGAAAIILAHNHPSGSPEPSEEDLAITRRISECGRLLGITLLDHIVIGNGAFVSLKERRCL